MKNIILILLISLLFSCKEKQKEITTTNQTKQTNFNWLIGKWKRTNEKEGKNTYEHWLKKSDFEYVGIGFTMKEKDTLTKENMQIVKNDNHWELIVSVVGKGDDTSATTFKMIKKNKNSFTCENKEIDFPNTIHYEYDNNTLKAKVSNSEMSIPFVFKKLNK